MAEKNVWGSLCGLGVARGPRGAGSKNRGQDDRRVLIRTIVPHRASKEPEWIPLEVVIVERRRRSSDDGVGVRRVVEVVVLDQPVRQVDDRASTAEMARPSSVVLRVVFRYGRSCRRMGEDRCVVPMPSAASTLASHSDVARRKHRRRLIHPMPVPQAVARFAACDSLCSCLYSRSPEVPPCPSEVIKFFFAREGDVQLLPPLCRYHYFLNRACSEGHPDTRGLPAVAEFMK